jgi:hypothetical protein
MTGGKRSSVLNHHGRQVVGSLPAAVSLSGDEVAAQALAHRLGGMLYRLAGR